MVPSRGAVTFFAPPKKVTKEMGSPVRRRDLVASCGPLRYSTGPAVCATRVSPRLLQIHQARISGNPAGTFPTRPVLDRNPGPICVARRRTGAPRSTTRALSSNVPRSLQHTILSRSTQSAIATLSGRSPSDMSRPQRHAVVGRLDGGVERHLDAPVRSLVCPGCADDQYSTLNSYLSVSGNSVTSTMRNRKVPESRWALTWYWRPPFREISTRSSESIGPWPAPSKRVVFPAGMQ